MLLLPLSQSPGADARRSLFLLVSSGTSRLTIRFAKWMAWLKTVLSSCCTSSCWVDLLRVGQRRSCSAAKSIAVFSWCWPSGSLTQKTEQNKSRVNTHYCMCAPRVNTHHCMCAPRVNTHHSMCAPRMNTHHCMCAPQTWKVLKSVHNLNLGLLLGYSVSFSIVFISIYNVEKNQENI